MERELTISPDFDENIQSDGVDSEDSANSTSSELGRIGAGSRASGAGTPTERGLAKTKREEDIILKTIEATKALGSNTLDLCHKGLLQIPHEIWELSNLEYLYLEGNQLSALPDDFFDKLPNLVWLDVRRNNLLRLPSVYTGRHQHLRSLLLESNRLRSLPLELGLIKSLNGLNISNNPIEFPPKEVMEKGTTAILHFLREMLHAKSTGKMTNGGNGDDGAENDSSSSSDDWQDEDDLRNYARRKHIGNMEDMKSTTTKSSDMFGVVPHSAELHRPVSYTEMKQEKKEKLQKAGAAGTVDSYQLDLKELIPFPQSSFYSVRQTQSFVSHMQCNNRRTSASNSVLSWKVNPYPEPPPSEYVTFKMNEERKIAKVKDLREKTDAIIQRRKDEELLKEWRHETKKLQQKRYFDSLRRGTKDFVDPVEKAPFDVDKNHMKMPTNEERIKQDVKNAHERIRRALSPTSRQKIEDEKSARIRELERRIKQHTSQMHDRRKQPKGSPQEEMEAAKRELDVAENLHKELSKSRKKLEYRFRAFTGDLTSGYTAKRNNAVPQLPNY
ncbi:leucine-rich repeat-containing protein 27-like isoform X3 [Mizuhopecten yessoensis]|uniref:Leucine-rich repeat-containing protein 27 n=1 Tax=Mizuhopecten yessoensis TaxID=6573 RepID=A0A210QSU0_MIZYE|nr:leucine-rich repeat-containing protein 27-like isoform X3 [Mizuhopecten yessoensis]OWF51769.1 Leucine-rich repeat-containing protein 27 [Mizuhopecten yessoensis]